MGHHNDGCSPLWKELLTGALIIVLAGFSLLACTRLNPSEPPRPTATGVYTGRYPTAVPKVYERIQSFPSGKKVLSILPPGGLGKDIRDLALDVQGRLWVATHIGLGVWDGEQWVSYNAATSPLPHNDVRAVAVAPDGETAWIGTANGLARVRGQDWITMTHENVGLSSPVINDLAFDQDGTLWAATSFGGLAFYDSVLWSYYDKYNSGLLGLSVSTLTIGPHGRLWMVDDFGDGISTFDGQRWAHYTEENSGLITNWVKQIAVDSEGRVWFTSRHRLSVLDGETWNPFDLSPVYEDFFSPRRLAQGPDGRIWVAGVRPDGTVVYNFTPLELTTGQIHTYVIPPIAVPEGEHALPPAVFLDNQGTPVPEVEEFASADPQVLLPTEDGAWLGTSYGLFFLHNGGESETIPLPHPQPSPRSLARPTRNPVVDFLQIYEFHPDHVRVTAIGTVEVQNSYAPDPWVVCDQSSGPDLYNSNDVTEFVISDNITLCEGTNLNNMFRPVAPPPVGERFTYWMSEVVHRLPHLHTPNPIEPEQTYHFGASASRPSEGQNWLRALAFPVSADILKVHGTPPTAEVIVNDWRVFVYDLRETNRPHVDFILHNDVPAPSLESYLEAAGWRLERAVQ